MSTTMRWTPRRALLISLLTCSACSTSPQLGDGSPSADTRAQDSAGLPDSARDGLGCVGADGLACLQTSAGTPSNFACTGTEPKREPRPPVALFLRKDDVEDNGAPGVGLKVEIFPDNVITDTCTGTCITLVADALGNVSVKLDTGWFAYRVLGTGSGAADVAVSVGYRLLGPDDTSKRLGFVTNNALNQLAAPGKVHAPGTVAVQGTLYDCDDRPAWGPKTPRIFANGVEVNGGSSPSAPYLGWVDGLMPNPNGSTGPRGHYGAINVPVPNDGTIRIEVWGNLVAGGPPQRLGCEEARVFADAYVTRPIHAATRSPNAPPGCAGK